LLAGRYRIVTPLGKGGMGEVFRADDLALGQPVALKFLPEPLADDPDRLQRFRKEVALARRVSHPGCCRVYDLAEHDGQPFLTMEFVDGEDLAGLLRRVGRLPEEKAVEVARQLCAALAAVHEQGLLHRDLKPANVMLDGRGKVRLADFGLAGAAEEAGETHGGTPAYMAPEQLAGQEASARSDLYALGLVLYELFTGRKAYTGTDRAAPPSKPSSHVSGLSPAVEKTLLRCLAADAAEQPASANEVLAGLPGDPLADALAAGQTPSPQLVADAGGEGTIRPGVGLALLGMVVGGIVLIALLSDQVMLFRKVPLPEPPEVLARQARQILEHSGYLEAPADTAFHFRVNPEYLLHALPAAPSPGRWDDLAAVRPPPLYFFYRQSPGPLTPTAVGEEMQMALVTDDNPPPTLPGMAGVHLDPAGKLLRLYAIPVRHSDAPATPPDPDWAHWFDRQTIGFDLEKDLKRAPLSEWPPPCACDRQAAWTGTLPGRPDLAVRVEAAAYRGRPVYFEVMPAWREDERPDALPGHFLQYAVFVALLAGLGLLAVRNVRRGRGDLRSAMRLGLAIVGAVVGAWLLGGHHSPSREMSQLVLLLGVGGWLALLNGLSYLALEPAIRRRWPWRIIAWNRLLDGRLRDPMVGRDLLIGLALGCATLVLVRLVWLAAAWAGLPPPPLTGTGPFALRLPGPPTPLYVLLAYLYIPIIVPLMYVSLSFVCLLVLRREWLAWGAVFLFFTAVFAVPFLGPSPAANAVTLLVAGIWAAAGVLPVARFGLLVMAGMMVNDVLSLSPLTADLSAWYAPQGVVVALFVTGLAVYAFFTATRGQPLFREGLFGDE
jgi:serine/threonine-protein kinase